MGEVMVLGLGSGTYCVAISLRCHKVIPRRGLSARLILQELSPATIQARYHKFVLEVSKFQKQLKIQKVLFRNQSRILLESVAGREDVGIMLLTYSPCHELHCHLIQILKHGLRNSLVNQRRLVRPSYT